MRPTTVIRIASSAALGLFLMSAPSSAGQPPASSCKVTEATAISMQPAGTVTLFSSGAAFQKLSDRYNIQRMSLGYGRTVADRISVSIMADDSVMIIMSLGGCILPKTGAVIELREWKIVMQELGLTLKDFTIAPKELSL